MLEFLKTLIARAQCEHDFKYSRSKPGTLVCKKCRARRPKP